MKITHVVERVIKFRTEAKHEEFMDSVANFEAMLVRSGVTLIKYYPDISKSEQKKRLKAHKSDSLRQWKISLIDELAIKHWRAYSSCARNEMLARSSRVIAP